MRKFTIVFKILIVNVYDIITIFRYYINTKKAQKEILTYLNFSGCTGGESCSTGYYEESLSGDDLGPGEFERYDNKRYDECWALASIAQANFFSWTDQIGRIGACKISKTCSPPILNTPQQQGFKLYECKGKSI